MRKTQHLTPYDITTDKGHTNKIILYERDGITSALCLNNPLIFNTRVK